MAKKVGVLGSGVVGRTLAEGFLKHGYEVMLGTRDPAKGDVPAWVSAHPGAKAGTFRETAVFGDIVVLSVLGRVIEEVIEQAGPDHLTDKVVIDTTNPLAESAPVDGIMEFTTGPNDSLGEKVQSLLPNAHVVKAFNSVGSPLMVNPKFEQGTPTMFLCGNYPEARRLVSEICVQFGWEPFDCGGIAASRALEPLCMLWCLPGFQRNDWRHAFKMLTH
ncbi:MAG: oxidoreductase, coenzyme F420-dependent [Bryobacterales bacterium]|jgi:predicted dinucleotide-binding enzyme|nr:oxidoreductase, coenzyme F420-dependent [Bryobacterales bacterium]